MIFLLLGLEGFIGLSYQILFFRQLTPHVGSSAIMTGWIIGVFLGALALGYKMGGKKRETPLSDFGLNLLLCAIIAGIATSSMFLNLYFETMAPMIGRLNALILYCLLSVGPVAFLMGQALPLLMQVKTFGISPSEKGGNALFLSTLGSMAGAIIPITLIAPYTGVTPILSVMLWLTGLTGLLLLTNSLKKYLLAATLPAIQALIVAPHFLFPAGGFLSTAYADINLVETQTEKLMLANGLTMSAKDLNGTNVSSYIDTFQKTIRRLNVTEENIVVLGAGGFMAHRDAPGNNRFTYVDIDPSLKDWAEKFFGFDSYGVDIVDDDARSFMLSQSDSSLKVIFMDTYSTAYDAPEHLMTVEYFNLIRRKLDDDGVIIINTLMDPLFRDDFSKRFYNTIRYVFPYCQIYQNNGLSSISNVQFTCVKQDIEKGIYRDSKNQIGPDVWETRKGI